MNNTSGIHSPMVIYLAIIFLLFLSLGIYVTYQGYKMNKEGPNICQSANMSYMNGTNYCYQFNEHRIIRYSIIPVNGEYKVDYFPIMETVG